MRNIDLWRPTKFVLRGEEWAPSPDPRELSPGSRHTSGRALRGYVAAIRTHARGKLLDLGSGKAPLHGVYAPYSTDVTCVDWPSSPHQTLHVDVFADLNEPLPLDSEAYDTVLSTSVLEHIWRHDVLWSEMYRVLRPGGRLILGTPFMYWLHEEPHDFFRWTRHALARATQEAGLELLEIEEFGSGVDVLADVVIKLAYARSRRIGDFAHSVASWAGRRDAIRRFSDLRGARLPLGYVMVAERLSR